VANPGALLETLLAQLPPDVRSVVVRLNGLDGRPPGAIQEVARVSKMSRGHVRALLENGEQRLSEAAALVAARHQNEPPPQPVIHPDGTPPHRSPDGPG
jgi:hypothetical protein